MPSFHGCTAASPTTRISGWPAMARSCPTRIRPDRSVSAPAASATARPKDAASTPAAHRTVRAPIVSRAVLVLHAHVGVADVDDARPRADGDPEPRQLGRRGRRPVGRVHRQDAVDGLDELDARVLRPDRPEVGAQRVVGDLAQRPGQLDAGRPAAHEHEGHPLPAPVGVRLALGRLERDEDPAPDLRGVVDGLEARRVRRPLVVPEVAVPGAGRDDERVVREVEAVRRKCDLAARPGRCPSPRPAGPSCCAACGRSSAAAARSRPATGRPSPPGRAAAGTGGGSAGRPASRPPGRPPCAAPARRTGRRTRRPRRRRDAGDAAGAGSGGRGRAVIEPNASAGRASGSTKRPLRCRRGRSVRRVDRAEPGGSGGAYLSCEVASTAWAAARRATGTRNGEQDT